MRIDYFPPQLPDTWLAYQRYYAIGLEMVAERLRIHHPAVGLIPGVDNKMLALVLSGKIRQRISAADGGRSLVGRYAAQLNGRTVKFAIDPRDSHPIYDPEILEWSDVFFKSNRWPTVEYDAKVLPIVNGNGFVGQRQIRLLKRLRDHPKDLDLVFISTLRGGIEHNVRLFEELAKLDCNKELLAIFPPGFDDQTRAVLGKRLASAGVPIGGHLPLKTLWRTLARAKVVFSRSGHHLCIPWRMIDVLCMGACIAYDAPPIPQWPEPLLPDVHYANCGTLDRSNPDSATAHYERLLPTLEGLLHDTERIESLRHAARTYFDEHAAPERVADYVVRTLASRASTL